MTSRSALACVAALLAVTAVACSSESTRTPYTDAAPTVPAETPEQNNAPVATPQAAPATTETDAGLVPDAPDTCKRTAPSKACGLVPQCGCTLAETCDVEDSSGNVGCVT